MRKTRLGTLAVFFVLAALGTSCFAQPADKGKNGKTPAPASASAAAPGTAAPAAGAPGADALTRWVEAFFPYGAGETKQEEVPQIKIPGARLLRFTRSFTADSHFNDQAFVVMEEGAKALLVGDVLGDEERLKAPAPVKGDADLDGMRTQLKRYFRSGFKLSFDPSLDRRGWKGVLIKNDTGYGAYSMSAYLKADDGAVLLIGRPWDRGRPVAEQRKELIKVAGTPLQGPADAKVTVVEYSDMQCGYCKKRTADWETLVAKIGKELPIKRYIKSFPLADHSWAFRAASAGRCFFDVSPNLYFRWKSNIYAKQDELTVAGVDSFALDFAVANEVPEESFKSCYLQAKTSEKVIADLSEGFAVRVRSTPTYFIDGVAVSWFYDNVMEEYLRKTYLGGKGLPLPTPVPTKTP
jgi:protein-disulfide isomerase